MDITQHINDFVKQNQRRRNKPYYKICKNLLVGGKPYSLNSQTNYSESEYLPSNIRDSVAAYSSNKDMAIALYKDFVEYLRNKGITTSDDIVFPPIPVSNTFERLMFIAKYLQKKDNKISELPEKLWVSDRTIKDDLSRLRGLQDPIQVCGKKFYIPDTTSRGGVIKSPSTAHPIFLAENLTQILVLLKGLRTMSENPLYEPYALQTGREIWNQLSPYAKKRIRFVLEDLMPEDYAWYESLAEDDDYHFHTEAACSQIHNEGPHVILECIKNEKPFCVEYENDGNVSLYTDCIMEPDSYSADPFSIVVNCSGGRVRLLLDHVIRSARSLEELTAN